MFSPLNPPFSEVTVLYTKKIIQNLQDTEQACTFSLLSPTFCEVTDTVDKDMLYRIYMTLNQPARSTSSIRHTMR